MRKSIALKTLLRSPAKTLLTFLLVAAASFTLFSRVVDYAVTTREATKAESFYSGVAALDNTSPMVLVDEEVDGITWTTGYQPEGKPWPTDEKIEEFSSLPGVTLADTRYMTAGKIEGYKRLDDKTNYGKLEEFVLEGTYDGYEEYPEDPRFIDLIFQNVTVYAGEIEVKEDKPLKIRAYAVEELYDGKNPYPKAFFDELEKGSRCLAMGENMAGELTLRPGVESQEASFRVIDGLGDDYLETEDFALYREQIDVYHEGQFVYDIVYTKDIRAIPRFNERLMVISEGRPLVEGDADADVCVVSEDFLETNGLSVGDRIHVELGDIFIFQNCIGGAQPVSANTMPNYVDEAELEIIGAYRILEDYAERAKEYEWSYTPSTVFVPVSLLPVEVPDDHEVTCAEFSVLIEDANDIEAFREAAEPFVAEMGLGMRFSDGGWASMEDSFKTGTAASILTTALYVAGALLALLLATYLYIGRNKESYAIMRTLGVSGKTAGHSVALPFVILSVFAMPVGGISGLFYASYTAAKTLANMADSSAPDGYVYVLDATLPVGVIIICMISELAFASFMTLFFLWKMKKISPLELLQEGTLHTGAGRKKEKGITDLASAPAGFDITKISEVDEALPRGKYGMFRQTASYILRHMRRGIGKTAVSLVLAVVLTAGIGMLALARLAYQDAYREVEVKGRALDFASFSITELSKSNLMKDFYCYNNFPVRINGVDLHTPMIATNDIERYLVNHYTITYADGYDNSVLDKTGSVCLVGQTLAETMDIHLGDEIGLISDSWYSAVKHIYEDKGEELLRGAIERETKSYKVVGIVETKDANASGSVFAGINSGVEDVYGQPFPYGYSEFTLADNGKLNDLNSLMESQKKESQRTYAPSALFHIDSESLKNIERVRDLLEALFPIAVVAAVLIGMFGSGLVVVQLAQEAAFLRVLGVTKKRTRCMLIFQQVILCMAGMLFAAGTLFLCSQEMFARSAQTLAACWTIYFIGGICGAFVAAVQVTRHKVLELLQVKE